MQNNDEIPNETVVSFANKSCFSGRTGKCCISAFISVYSKCSLNANNQV